MARTAWEKKKLLEVFTFAFPTVLCAMLRFCMDIKAGGFRGRWTKKSRARR